MTTPRPNCEQTVNFPLTPTHPKVTRPYPNMTTIVYLFIKLPLVAVNKSSREGGEIWCRHASRGVLYSLHKQQQAAPKFDFLLQLCAKSSSKSNKNCTNAAKYDIIYTERKEN